MSTQHPYHYGSQQRALQVLLVLFGHEIDGLSPSQIAKAVQASPSAITRDIHNLVVAGYVEQVPHNGQYRVSPMLGRKALAILHTIERAAQRVEETRNRYTRNA